VREPFVLAVDDVHLISSPQCTGALAALIDRLPARSTVALATRAELPFALDELRHAGRVVELEADDLRMNDSEANELLTAAGVELRKDDVAELNERAEGWPTGLHLAALVLGSRDAPPAPAAFGGADRFVTDYFRGELLAGLFEHDVEFLARVSVLDRMCGPLCDAILDRSGSAETLAALAQANLFVIPLDGERRWFRLHHLFCDMLREELERRDPGLAATLSARAATWSEDNDDLEAAIEYAFAAGDTERAARLVERTAMPAYWNGRHAAVMRWFSRLDDPALLQRRPVIAVIGSWTHALDGQSAAADHWAQLASAAKPGRRMPDGGSAASWQANLRALRCADGPEAMQNDAELAVAKTPVNSPWSSSTRLLLGIAALLAGDGARADATFAETVKFATKLRANVGLSMALAERSLLAAGRGDRAQVDAFARAACETVHESGLDHCATSAIVYAASARAEIERGDTERAREDVQHIERLAPQLTHAVPWLAVQVRIELARLHLAFGNASRATQVVAELDDIVEHRPDLGVLNDQVAELRSRLETWGRPDGGWETTLTTAELRLLPLLTTHLSYREIAEQLDISRNTVKTQAISVYRKLGVSSRSEAIERATELGLL
jgi:LuxR family maltose regulon positive regulatory protein